MKKILALILAVLMLATMLPAFASCSNKNKEFDLANAQIVYADSLSKLSVKKLNNMKKTISDATGAEVKALAESKATAAEFEILVGNTTRPETEKALKKMKDAQGYTIQVVKNKVVIVGTNDALTYIALQEFEKTYFSTVTGNSVLSIPAVYTDTDSPLLELVQDGKFSYTVVYSRDWDDSSSEGRDKDDDGLPKKPTETLDVVDYQYRQVDNLLKSINSATGLKANSSNDKKAGKGNEIIVGSSSRPETATALAMINEQQYIVTTVNGCIVATAWNDQGVKLAAEKLAEILSDCVVKGEGGTTLTYPAELTFIGTYDSKWVTDFPKPTGDGINLLGTMDVSDGHVEYCYNGSGVSMAGYEAYAAQLTAAGYTVFSDKTIEGSRFTTFNNTDTDVMLHVTFTAYAHTSESSPREPLLRVISAKLSKITQPDVTPNFNYTNGKVFTDANVGADTGALICQMYLRREESNNFGNCFVTMLEDGSFILYDGGGSGTGDPDGSKDFQDVLVDTKDHLRIIETMRDLRKLVDPSASGPVTLAAWIMSHGHFDHIEGFKRFCRDNGNQVVFERAYANFPSVYETINSYNPGSGISILDKAMDQTQGDTKYVKMHTGQTFWVRNAEIEVIYTHEDLYPERALYYNETSTVYRVNYHVTDGKGNLIDGEHVSSCMWLGDAQQQASAVMSETYGDFMKSDMVQLAHHGYPGCERLLYSQIKPELVWWPVWGYDFIDQVYLSTGSGYNYSVDRYVALQLESVKWIVVAGAITANNSAGYDSSFMFSTNQTTGNLNYQDLRHDYTLRVTNKGFDGDKLYCANEDPKLPVGSTAKDAFNTKAPANGKGYWN